MSSNAFSSHLRELLIDAEQIGEAHTSLSTGNPGRQYKLAALNRAAVVMCISAWESYIEELMRESLRALLPVVGPPPAFWPALSNHVMTQVRRFNTPDSRNVKNLIDACIGLQDIRLNWVWRNQTPIQAAARLDSALNYRHEIAHGVNPRPVIHNHYSDELPEFIRKLARRTDDAVRQHLVSVHLLGNPWPV